MASRRMTGAGGWAGGGGASLALRRLHATFLQHDDVALCGGGVGRLRRRPSPGCRRP